MVKLKALEEAWRISLKDISEELGGLPSVKFHRGVLAVGAMRRAIRAFYKDRPQPEWLPKDHTLEER
jgi:nitrogen fixation NifU-like protein